jgi:hypothetical protein
MLTAMTERGFKLETEMVPAVSDWFRKSRLTVKEEFSLPWGICDLVGVSLNLNNVRKRLALKQTKAIGPLWRVDLLRYIPDQETGRTISVQQLERVYGNRVPTPVITTEIEKLVADHFVLQTRTGSLQKLNGWMPLQKRIVAVELKLKRVSEALCQAASNRAFATESFVALPWETAHRLSKGRRVSEFDDAGVGILAVGHNACRVMLPASTHGIRTDLTLQMHCVERFWRSRDSSA